MRLPRLLRAADAVADAATDDLAAVKVLLDAGTGSLGGARPKASVREGDELKIAKFPHPGDEWDVMAWEMTVLDLAERVGITTTGRRLVDLGGPRALLLDRFDRQGPHRRGFVSAMTLTGGRDGETADYLEVAEAIADHGTSVVSDLRQLWLRMAFSLAVNNRRPPAQPRVLAYPRRLDAVAGVRRQPQPRCHRRPGDVDRLRDIPGRWPHCAAADCR